MDNDMTNPKKEAEEIVRHFQDFRLLVKRGYRLRAEDEAYLKSEIASALEARDAEIEKYIMLYENASNTVQGAIETINGRMATITKLQKQIEELEKRTKLVSSEQNELRELRKQVESYKEFGILTGTAELKSELAEKNKEILSLKAKVEELEGVVKNFQDLKHGEIFWMEEAHQSKRRVEELEVELLKMTSNAEKERLDKTSLQASNERLRKTLERIASMQAMYASTAAEDALKQEDGKNERD